jgi:hypothetical protein
MAERRDWDNTPYDELSLDDINYHNQSYETILHLSAYRASLSSFPERLLTHSNLSKKRYLDDEISYSLKLIIHKNPDLQNIKKKKLKIDY